MIVPRTDGRRTVRTAASTLAAAAALILAAPGSAQEATATASVPAVREVTLTEAVATALEHNARLRISGQATARARAREDAARAPLLPQLDVEAGWNRTVDPVGVFGTKLRQGRFEQEDLALDALNDPAPISDWTGRATLRWELAAPRRWAARAAASDAARAAAWSEARSRDATILGTRIRFYDVLRSEDAVAAARAALEAAEATLERFRRRREEGMLTRADVLQARAERSAALAEVADAERVREEARTSLAVHLGWSPDDSLPEAAGDLSPPEPLDTAVFDPVRRADLRARRAAVEAAENTLDRAQLAWAPSVGAFAAWSTHGVGGFDDDGTDWTIGVGLRWRAFTGFRRSADASGARAELTTARIEYEQALREARAEVRVARRAVRTARRAYEAAREAREAAREGRDLMRRRFEEGLATPADLLQAEARAARTRARAVEALARYHMAAARLDFVRADTDREELP